MKKVNSIMVAQTAGVAQSTVSLVVNNSPRVTDETRRRVIEAARELGYELTPRNKRMMIGVIISRVRPILSWQMMALTALKDEIYKRKYRMEIICNEDIQLLNDRLVSGAISITTDPHLNTAWGQLKNIPLVRLNGFSSHADNVYRVMPDTFSDIAQLYRSLYSAGHRAIGLFLSKTPEEENLEGVTSSEAFCAVARRYGIAEPEKRISFRDQHLAGNRLKRFLQQGITGIIAIPADTALILSREASRLGLNIPENLSLVTLEYAGVCENWNPPLTTLSRDYKALCVNALNLIENLLRRHGDLCDMLIPGRMIYRQSILPPNHQKSSR